MLQCDAVCCSVLQYVVVRRQGAKQQVAACCSVSKCVVVQRQGAKRQVVFVVCCSMLQYVVRSFSSKCKTSRLANPRADTNPKP